MANPCGISFDLTNPLATKWAAGRSSALIKGISAQTRSAIKDLIGRSFSEGLTRQQVSQLIRPLIGLSGPGARAVMNYRTKLLAQGLSPELIRLRLERYSAKLLRLRAQAIARTEIMAAANEGQRQLWLQAQKDGLLFNDELRVWILTGDNRLCPICEGSGGDLAPLDKEFPNGLMGPPAHPMCRCTTGLSGKRGKKARKPQTELPAAGPQSPLDRLLMPSPGDTHFARVPGGASLLGSAEDARRVLGTFDARIKALRRKGVQMDLRMSGTRGVGRRRLQWEMDPTDPAGRARIATVDTGIDNAAEAMARLRATGAVGRTEKMTIGFTETEANHYAHAYMHNGRVEINFNQPAWQSREALQRSLMQDAATGFHPVGGVDSILVHEMGHVGHARTAQAVVKSGTADGWSSSVATGYAKRDWEGALGSMSKERWELLPRSVQRAGVSDNAYAANLSKEIAREVSRYAQKNVNEFVAETYTGLVYGKKYSDDVMDLYKALGGPEVKAATKAPLVGAPKPLPVPPPTAPPVVPKPPVEKVVKPIRPVPEGEVGEEIRRIQALRAEGLDYTEIARRMEYDTTRRGKGWGTGPQKVFDTIKRYGDPLGRVAPVPL